MNTLTTKELSALAEQIGAEAVAVAKYNSLAQQSTEDTTRMMFMTIANKHQAHHDTLFNFLR